MPPPFKKAFIESSSKEPTMYKLLFVLRTSTHNGAGAAIYHVEFDNVEDADIAYVEAQSVGVSDLKIIKLYR